MPGMRPLFYPWEEPLVILNVDCATGMADLEDESVDLILTDPPYIKEVWEGAYTTLATQGARILKPSGYLISYCGHIHLLRTFGKPGDRVLDPFAGSGTTCLAAKALGMDCLGMEIDPKTHRVALGRMTQEPLTVEAFL